MTAKQLGLQVAVGVVTALAVSWLLRHSPELRRMVDGGCNCR